jgi:excisionase family DNA binding protein
MEARNLIPLKTAMERLCCGKTYMYDLIRAGKIAAYKDRGRTMVDADSVAAYLASLPRVEPRSV